MADLDAPHIPADWARALDGILCAGHRRVAVIGPTDAGKNRFVGALLARRPDLARLDLDPGQKMVGPPGILSLGRHGARLGRMWAAPAEMGWMLLEILSPSWIREELEG